MSAECARCTAEKPTDLADANYGKMRPSWNTKRGMGWYRCIARDRGYHQCTQPLMQVSSIDEQVIEELTHLTVPEGFQERVDAAIENRVENEEALSRIAELEETQKRIDFSWESGFLTPQEYVEKRDRLQQDMESLRPVEYDSLMEATDLLDNFTTYWDACNEVGSPQEACKQLLAKIIDRVFVYENNVIAIALHGDYAVTAPAKLVEQLGGEMQKKRHMQL